MFLDHQHQFVKGYLLNFSILEMDFTDKRFDFWSYSVLCEGGREGGFTSLHEEGEKSENISRGGRKEFSMT